MSKSSKTIPTPADDKQPAPDDGLTQSERFIKAAQELGTDDDPERFAERVRRLAQADSATSGAHRVQGHSDGKK